MDRFGRRAGSTAAAQEIDIGRLVEGQRILNMDRTGQCRAYLAAQEATGQIPAAARERYGSKVEDAMQLCAQLIRLDELQKARD